MRETTRLLLQDFDESHIDALYEIQGNRDAMKFTYWAESRAASAEHLWAYAASKKTNGFAPWTVFHKQDGRIIGWGGLSIDPFDTRWGPEVSYFIHPDHAGRGFATELVRETLNYGFTDHVLTRIIAFARPENTASIRVLTKSGFSEVGYVRELERNQYAVQVGD